MKVYPAIPLIVLLVIRALFGLSGGEAVWCDSGHHEHDLVCSHTHPHDSEFGLAVWFPVPADFHDLDCECTVDEKEVGGEEFTAPSRLADLEHFGATTVGDWHHAVAWDVRVPSFRGPPRAVLVVDHALSGRSVFVESTRLNV